jgi:endoglucanase
MKKIKILMFIVLAQLTVLTMAQSLSYDIRLNQEGFLPNTIKRAVIVNTQQDSFKVMTTDLGTTVYKGQLLPPAYYTSSGEEVILADFSLVTEPGEYVLVVDDLGKSVSFRVDSISFLDLTKASLKYYYYNRASTPVLGEYAGVYAREEGHADTVVVVHPSAATAERPAGTIISTPGGWYDAGDYNKYIVSSGISVFTLLSAYETYPEFYDTLNINIPESNNTIPDILDEALWNIRWMMTMQDTDGGVYNKTTDANFSGFIMPSESTSTRYVVAKGSAATLDFAAIMAMTARIYRKYDPVLADTALAQAIRAWQWAKENPDVEFTNPASSGAYPSVNTGEYGDAGFDDEFTWAAAELYITTKDPVYYNEINFEQSFGLPGWPVVQTLGLLSLVVNHDSLTSDADVEMILDLLIDAVSYQKNNLSTSPYRIPGDFYYWAGNNAFANWGMLFIQVFRLTGDASYYNAAVASLDYLLGKNATTYSFVTGTGTRSPMNPHHRISSADGVVDPVPGMLVGGANSGDVSDCGASSYPSTFPAKSYLDEVCSYSTNEVAIGINAVLAFLAGAVQADYLMNFKDSLPRYFTISTTEIILPYQKSDDAQVTIEGNTEWELTTDDDWIVISVTEGIGNAIIQINADADNPTESERSGKVYVYSQSTLKDSIQITQNGKRTSFRIEAEDYIDNSGTQKETTSDEGGGENIGYVDIDDWLTYNLDVSYDGFYDVTIRHAGYAGDIDIIIDGEFVKNITFPATADWQVWENYVFELALTEGLNELKLTFNAVGTNLNWYQFDWNRGLGVQDHTMNSLNIFPIPADDYITIEFGSVIRNGEIQVFSVEGKKLIHQTTNGSSFQRIDVSGLAAGIYILKVNHASEVISKALIKK